MPKQSSIETSTLQWIIPFVAVLFAMLMLQMSSLGFSPLLPSIQRDFHANYTEIGLFTGVYGLVAIILSVPAGYMARFWGEKAVLCLGLLIVALGLFVLSQAQEFVLGFIGRVIWLIGYRLAFVCVMIAVALTAPPRLKGSTMGIVGALSSLASVIGAPFGSQIEEIFNWRGAILAFAVLALLGTAVFAFYYTRRPDAAMPVDAHGHVARASVKGSSSRPAYKEPIVWVLAVTLGLLNVGGFTMTFFVPVVAKSIFKLGPMDGALIISTAYLAAMVANPICGFLSDRTNRWNVMIGIAVLLIPSSLALLSTKLPVFWIGATILVAMSLSATSQVYAIAGAALQGKETGPAMGIISLGAGVYGYLGPQMIGYLRDITGSFNTGFCMISGAAVIALIAMIALRRHSGHSQPRTGATV